MRALFLAIIFLYPIFGYTQDAKIWCDDNFSNEIREIDNILVKEIDSCVADVVWGLDNVCFEGSPKVLAERINSGDYRWPALFAQSAKVTSAGDVLFVGVDQQNFFSSEMTLTPCQ